MQFVVFLSCILFVRITSVYHDARFKNRKGLFVGFILGTDRYYGPMKGQSVLLSFWCKYFSVRPCIQSDRLHSPVQHVRAGGGGGIFAGRTANRSPPVYRISSI